ncbi:HAD family hydrolase [Candidatus Bathyarchaeota archaeon]|nr:HAD family hydrolase [Candidatus Bathyarchaeota archaeon]
MTARKPHQTYFEVDAVTFDDFGTLRFCVSREDIIYPILRELGKRIRLDKNKFLEKYFKMDASYHKKLQETLKESLLDDIIMHALKSFGLKPQMTRSIVEKAVDKGLATRRTRWYADVPHTLSLLRRKGYKLGLISNTHWRYPESFRNEVERIFEVITLSYEHGYAKPHPSIFLATLKKLQACPNRCLHAGDDHIADIEGAKGVGMKTAFIRRKAQMATADMNLEQLNELLKFL